MILIAFLLILLTPIPSWAATYYVAQTGDDSSSCATSQTITTPKLTFVSAVGCLNAGDTLYIRGGTWTTQIDLQGPNKTGTADGWITIAGYPGETVTIQYAETISGPGYGAIKARGNRGYFIFENLVLDGINSSDDSRGGWAFRDGNHDFTLKNIEIKNFKNASALQIMGDNITISHCKLHDQFSALLTSGTFHYGVYYHHGSNAIIEYTEIYNNVGGGVQVYPGPSTGAVIRNNYIHDNNQWPSVHVGGIEILASNVGGGAISNLDIYGNKITDNGSHVSAGTAIGLEVNQLAGNPTVSGVRVHNNVFYGNKSGGLQISGATADVRNNINTGNGGVQLTNSGSSTITHQACTTAESCGATSKIALTSSTACFVSSSDHRLAQGTNPCRDAGIAVSTRPSPVGATDIGAFEQGLIASATVAGGFIEVTYNLMTPGAQPTSACTGFTIANGTSTGTPVVSACVIKPSSNNVLLLSTTGFSGSGSCTISYGTGNVTDSGYVGPASDGIAQGPNSRSGLSVSGTCDNSAGGAPPAGSLHVHHTMNEGTGASLNDETVNNLDSTLSGSPTWTTGIEGGGVYFPDDAVDRRATFAYGNGIDATSQSFTFCTWVKPDAGALNKLVMGPYSGASNDKRLYIGIHQTLGTWGIGAGTNTIGATGASQFPSSAVWTRTCLVNDATTDTATLAVNGIKGTGSASVKSSASLTALESHFLIGCGILFTTNCGGYTVDEPKVWTAALSDAELLEDFASYTPPGSSVGGYEQKTHGWEGIYTYNGAPVQRGTNGQTAHVVAGGGIALTVQFDCTGGDCDPLAVRFYYSTDGANYDLPIPDTLGGAGIALWGGDSSTIVNAGTSTCCLTGALTANDGPTLFTTATSPTMELAQNASYQLRVLIRVAADKAGSTFYVRAKQDNGAELDGGATPSTGARLDVVPMSWSR